MSSPAAGGWFVWKIHKQSDVLKTKSRFPWGCVGMLAVALLLWQGLKAAFFALLAGQVLPILVLLLGQLPSVTRVWKLGREMSKLCPDKDAYAPFLGRLTERGIRMATGHMAPWSVFSSWTPGWEDTHVFRIHLRLAPGQDSHTLIQAQPQKWIFSNIVAVLIALYLALTLHGHGKALQACLYMSGAYLTLFLLRRWSSTTMRKLRANTPEEPWVLIFDARQVSMAEVEARLERYLPRVL